MSRWSKTDQPPEGLRYYSAFVSEEEESALVETLRGLEFRPVRMRGVTAKRTTIHFGWSYGYESWKIEPTEPIPSFLLALRNRVGTAADVDAGEFAEVLITRYPPGAGIGWHRDAPAFGAPVAGLSLLSDCTMKFRRELSGDRSIYSQPLARRSLYLLAGAARWQWQHSIAAAPALRYSITFRTVRASPAAR